MAESLCLQSLAVISRQVRLSANSTDNHGGWTELTARNVVSWAQRNQDPGDNLLTCADFLVWNVQLSNQTDPSDSPSLKTTASTKGKPQVTPKTDATSWKFWVVCTSGTAEGDWAFFPLFSKWVLLLRKRDWMQPIGV